jgi:hypothetical protein
MSYWDTQPAQGIDLRKLAMPRFDYLLLGTLFALAAVAGGQEPVLTGLPEPPVPAATEVPPADWLGESCYTNGYPMYRCEDGSCCRQWWCETWYARAELLTLARNYSASGTIIETAGGAPVFTGNDIGFGLAPGISTLLGHRLDGQTAVELVYFGANQWNQEQAFAQPGNLNLPGALGTLDDFNHANAMSVALRSQLHNAEVNYLHDVGNVSLLAGFRFLNWQEQLSIVATDSDASHSSYRVNLSNNMPGGQLGARVARYYGGIDFELTGKAGIFGNRASQAQGVGNLGNTVSIRNVGATNNEVSFIGDLNLSAVCPLTPNWRVRGGYNLMYVSGLALAVNQLDFSNQSFSGRRVHPNSDVFLHGFNVGLEVVW